MLETITKEEENDLGLQNFVQNKEVGCGNRCKMACPKKRIAEIGIDIEQLPQMTAVERAEYIPLGINNCGSCLGQIAESLSTLKDLERLEDGVFICFLQGENLKKTPSLHTLITQIKEMDQESLDEFCKSQGISEELKRKLMMV